MPIDIDGRAVLRTVVESDLFPDITPDLAKAARALVAKQLKAKKLTLGHLRGIHQALGSSAFLLIVEGLTESETKSLAGKVDKHHPEIKTGPTASNREHIVALAQGTAEPEPKPKKGDRTPKAEKAPATPKPKVQRALSSKAMAAKWDGKDRGK